jgi:Family of unknown function (DUF6166)
VSKPAIYGVHRIEGRGRFEHLYLDGRELGQRELERSLAVFGHSPDGFAWGYGGSGAAQSALAILLEVTDSAEMAERYHQHFKAEVVAQAPQGDFGVDVDFDAWLFGERQSALRWLQA